MQDYVPSVKRECILSLVQFTNNMALEYIVCLFMYICIYIYISCASIMIAI